MGLLYVSHQLFIISASHTHMSNLQEEEEEEEEQQQYFLSKNTDLKLLRDIQLLRMLNIL